MTYIYIWFEEAAWSKEPPTVEDQRAIDAGNLLVLESNGDPPRVFQGKTLEESKIYTTPEGTEYHFVP